MRKVLLLGMFAMLALIVPMRTAAADGDEGAMQTNGVDLTTPTRMTPLVGKHCIIDDLSTSVVSVLAGSVGVDNVLDEDITNYMQMGSTVAAGLAYQPIMAVKDLNHVYAAGTPAGFVIQPGDDTSSVLSADVIQMFTVATYLNGEKQEEGVASTSGAVLGAKVIRVSNANCAKIQFYTTKDFDEVRLVNAGINADVISNVKIYYAFVGENTLKPVTRTLYYPEADCDYSNVLIYKSEGAGSADYNFTIADSEDEYYSLNLATTLLGLTTPTFVIDLGEDIPANTEVGWLAKTATLLDLNLLEGVRIAVLDGEPYETDLVGAIDVSDIKNHILEEIDAGSVVGATLLGGGEQLYSFVTSQDEYTQNTKGTLFDSPRRPRRIAIQFDGVKVDLGTVNLHYAFTRDTNIYVEKECDLEVAGDMTLCGMESVEVYGEEGLTFSFEPELAGGASYQPSYNETGGYYLVEGLERFTTYEVTVTKDGCSRTFEIVNDPITDYSKITTRPIVGAGVEIFDGNGFVLLDVDLNNSEGLNNLIDEDLSNYYKYDDGLLALAGKDVICGVGRTDGEIYYASSEQPKRVGFVLEKDDAFLNAGLIDFYTITTYLQGVKHETHVVKQNEIVSLDLITNQTGEKVRASADFTKPFDQVVLSNTGLLDLSIAAKIKVYYAYEAPVTGKYDYGFDAYGMEFLSYDNGATICYPHSVPEFDGVASVAASTNSLGNLIDGDLTTYASITGLANVLTHAKAAVAVKSSTIYEGQGYAGFLIRNNDFLGNASVIAATKIQTYLDEVETVDHSINIDIVSADLLGIAGYGMIMVPVTAPFNEVRLSIDGVADAIDNLQIASAFYYADTDGDGVPDASDYSPCNPRSGFVSTPCGVYPVSVADVINNYNHYSHRVYLFAGYDFDGITSGKIGPNSYFEVYRRDDYPDFTKENPGNTENYTLLATVRFPEPVSNGDADIYTLTNSDITNESGHNVRIHGGSVRFEASHSNPDASLMPMDISYITDREYDMEFPVLMQLRDWFDVETKVNSHAEDYCYFIVLHAEDGYDYHSNIKTFDIPHSQIDVLPVNYDEPTVFSDVNMVIEHADEADVTVTGKADSYAITDSNGDSLSPFEGEVAEDGSNIEVEEGEDSANGKFETTFDNLYAAKVFEDNTIGDHNSYALPPADTDVPKIEFIESKTKIKGAGYDRIGEETIQILNLDEEKYEPVYFNIWRIIDDEEKLGELGVYHDPINLFDDYVGFDNTLNDRVSNMELVNCHVIPGSVDEVAAMTDLTMTKDPDAYIYTHTDPVSLHGNSNPAGGGVQFYYIARLYSKVKSDGPDKVRAGAGEVSATPKYVVSEARIEPEVLIGTGVEEVVTDAGSLYVRANSDATLTIISDAPAVVTSVSGITVARVNAGTASTGALQPGVYIISNGHKVVKYELH